MANFQTVWNTVFQEKHHRLPTGCAKSVQKKSCLAVGKDYSSSNMVCITNISLENIPEEDNSDLPVVC